MAQALVDDRDYLLSVNGQLDLYWYNNIHRVTGYTIVNIDDAAM